jgi:hypothetical protein
MEFLSGTGGGERIQLSCPTPRAVTPPGARSTREAAIGYPPKRGILRSLVRVSPQEEGSRTRVLTAFKLI